jgi:hypothetical protein
MNSIFVNGNRTKEQRKARYCFFGSLGLNRKEKRMLSGWRDEVAIRYLQQKYSNQVK